jgi:hypothetical protein
MEPSLSTNHTESGRSFQPTSSFQRRSFLPSSLFITNMAPDPTPETILRPPWRAITESFNTNAQLLSSRYLYITPFVSQAMRILLFPTRLWAIPIVQRHEYKSELHAEIVAKDNRFMPIHRTLPSPQIVPKLLEQRGSPVSKCTKHIGTLADWHLLQNATLC